MKKLKILTIDRPNDDGYWIAGVFDNEEEIKKYISLFFFEEPVFDIEDIDYPPQISALPNGEYVYQVIMQNPETFIIEKILDPQLYQGPTIKEDPKKPLRIIMAAKNAAELKIKCLQEMQELNKV